MRNGDHVTLFDGLIHPSLWCVHLQRLMDAIVIVVFKILLQNSMEMRFAEDDDLVETSGGRIRTYDLSVMSATSGRVRTR